MPRECQLVFRSDRAAAGAGVLHSSRSGVAVKTSTVPLALRFGVFELDSRARELRKKGMKIRPRGAERNPVAETRATLSSPAPSQSRVILQAGENGGQTTSGWKEGTAKLLEIVRGYAWGREWRGSSTKF